MIALRWARFGHDQRIAATVAACFWPVGGPTTALAAFIGGTLANLATVYVARRTTQET